LGDAGMSEVEKFINECNLLEKQNINIDECWICAGAVRRISEELQERINKIENLIPDALTDFEKRIVKIESVLNPYLKKNSRSDIDRLEQRLGIIEIGIKNLQNLLLIAR
jgi:hypothetical protein